MPESEYFKPVMPKGYRIFFPTFEIMFVKEYRESVDKIRSHDSFDLRLEAEPQNEQDSNAHLVVALKKGFFGSKRYVFGYIPKGIAKQVAEQCLTKHLIARPREVWEGDRGGFIFKLDLVGPKSHYEALQGLQRLEADVKLQSDAASAATALQKEYFKHFGIKFKRGTTKGGAASFIAKHTELMLRASDARLNHWRQFEEHWEELCDPDFREDECIKKPTIALAREVFIQWAKEDDLDKEPLDNVYEFVERLIAAKPDIRR